MNKKGIFIPIFVVFTLLLLSTSAVFLYISNKKSIEFHVGGRSSEIFSTYSNAEKALFYIDKSAEFSFYKSINNNMNNLDTKCGEKEGYDLLVLGTDTCFLDNDFIKTRFETVFNKYMSEYLNLYKDLSLKDITFDLDFIDKKIIGRSTSKILVDKNNIKYTMGPSFVFENSFDVNEVFISTSDKIKRIYVLCKSDKTCWENKLDKNFKLKNNGKFFMLDIDTGYKFGLNNEKLMLKFGLEFETNPLFR